MGIGDARMRYFLLLLTLLSAWLNAAQDMTADRDAVAANIKNCNRSVPY